MDHRDLHNIMNNVSTQLFCPYCRGKVSTKNCQLVNIVEDDCVLATTCPHCSQRLMMGAHIEKHESWQDMVSNASTLIQNKFKKTGVGAKDIGNVKKALKSYKGDITKLFA